MIDKRFPIPSLRELGTDLLVVTPWQKLLAIAYPFLWCGAYFAFAVLGYWPLAVGSLICLSFVTYGSTSHDLVHRNPGSSSLCGTTGVHCFTMDALIIACDKCGTENAIRTDSGENGFCTSCRQNIPSPASGEDALISCYQCLRAGLAVFTKDTVLGMVTWDQAIEGLTHGIPGLKNDHFELVPSDDDPEWMRARVSPNLLLELVRTPPYTTWQGERWHFCCRRPMIYVGEWKETDFKRNAPNGDGKAFFKQTIVDGVDESFWGILQNIGGPYIFRCSQCGIRRGHYDMD